MRNDEGKRVVEEITVQLIGKNISSLTHLD